MKHIRRSRAATRTEHDAIGTLAVPADAYYGIQTRRAALNFPISGRRLPDVFLEAYVRIKQAAAEVNRGLGRLDRRRAGAITRAASEILAGRYRDQFVVDVYQAGAGTSQNMNLNEVIANRANEILGGRRGDYAIVHPNDHVNMSQSTNDTFPAAMRLAILMSLPGLRRSLDGLVRVLHGLERRFASTAKSARTHLQDAVPIMLGQEFGAYAAIAARARLRLDEAAGPLRRLNLGATAAGTGLNADPRYAARIASVLSRRCGLRLRPASNQVEIAMSSADFVHVSAALRNAAIDFTKIANDLRLLASGPATGLAEIELPAVQPGSSIMPGKVNPVMCEMLNMVCYQVVGHDQTVAWAAAAGQLELNVMMPVMAWNILDSMTLLERGLEAFGRLGLAGIRADRERCRFYFERSPSLATALTPLIGYEQAAELAKQSVREHRTIVDLVRERGLLDERTLRRDLDPARLTRPGILAARRRGSVRKESGGAARSGRSRRR